MEVINDMIRCSMCSSILVKPVFLPCGHSICKHHEEKVIKDCCDDIYCATCDKAYSIPESGLPPNRTIESLLKKRFDCINLDNDHLKMFEKCDFFASVLNDFKKLENPDLILFETISELKNRIDLRREELKLEIDQEAMKLIDRLEEYESKCKSSISLIKIDNIRSVYAKFENNLKQWREELETFERDVSKWNRIFNELETDLSELEVHSKFWKAFMYPDELDELQDIDLILDEQLAAKYSNKCSILKSNEINPSRKLTVELNGLSKMVQSNDTFDFFSEHLSALNIDFQVGVRVSRRQDNCQHMQVFLFANLNEEVRTCDMFVDYDVFLVNRFEQRQSSAKKVFAMFTNDDGLGDITSLIIDNIISNHSFYNPQNDSCTIQVVIEGIRFIKKEPTFYPYPPMNAQLRWPKQLF